MNKDEFVALFADAATHAKQRMLENDGMFCSIELHHRGFRVYASYPKRDMHSQRIVPFAGTFLANFPILKAEVDRAIADVRDFAEKQPGHAA